jgi:hypothetical protein
MIVTTIPIPMKTRIAPAQNFKSLPRFTIPPWLFFHTKKIYAAKTSKPENKVAIVLFS